MKLKHHRFRFGLIGNLKVLICRIFGHRVSDDPTGFACQRCRLAYEEIYSPGYWGKMLEWFGSDDRDDDVEISMPILDGSEMIGEETADEYLDRLVVDPQQFLDEVRGRNAGLEWKTGAPEEEGMYLLVMRTVERGAVICFFEFWDQDDIFSRSRRILWHIGPIPPVPQNDEK